MQQQKNAATPFRRVKAEEVSVDHRLKDNSFEAKVSFRVFIFICHTDKHLGKV
jgi:hypothetical protein